jgi:acyl carrier protein
VKGLWLDRKLACARVRTASNRGILKLDASACRQELLYFIASQGQGAIVTDQVFERVQAVIVKHQRIPSENVTINSTFEELKIDSLDRINLLFAVEEEFGISIPTEEIKSVNSVREISEGVEKILVGRSGRKNDSALMEERNARTKP